MGSQLTKNYEVDRDPKSEGGITGAWKIYSATRRDREKTPVSIFTFDKRVLDRKPNKQEVVNRLKAEINGLIRLRHPNLLQILEPMLEDKTTIAWVTEPLEYCLGDLLRRPHILSNCLGDTETRLGVLDVIQGLTFLHNEARLVHMALCPDNIYISLGGKWKVGGLNFASAYTQDSPAKLENVDIIASAKSFRYQIEVDRIAPLLHFSAPEVVSKNSGIPASDVFSLGCTIYSTYKALSNTSSDLLMLEIEDFSPQGHLTACRNVGRSGNLSFGCLPDTLPELVVKMLAVSPSERSGLHELSVSKSLQTPYVKTIYYLEHLQEKQDAQKMQFFKGLITIIAKFDKVIMFKRLLPALISNMQHQNLTPFILPSLLTILKTCDVKRDMFQAQIWPAVYKLATSKEIPAQSFFLILKEIELLVKYTETEAARKVLMPLVFKGYECGVPQIQIAIMEKTPDLIKELADSVYARQQILPRFLQAIVNSKTVAVKEAGLKVLSLIYNQFDRSTMVEMIIPSLEKFKKFDITGPMVMHLLTVYEGISKTLGHKATSVNILPALLPLLVEAELSKTEFERLFASMISMLHLIKDARSGELTDAKDEQIVEGVVNEEVEEVNDIFRDIFDTGHKTEIEVSKGDNDGVRQDFGKKEDFGWFKQDNLVVKQEVPGVKQEISGFKQEIPGFKPEIHKPKQEISNFKQEIPGFKQDIPGFKPESTKTDNLKTFDPLKGFDFKSDVRPSTFSVPNRAEPAKVDPFALDFGKKDPPKPSPYTKVEPKADFFLPDPPKQNFVLNAVKDPSQDFNFFNPEQSVPKPQQIKPNVISQPVVADIFGDLSKTVEESKAPKYNISIKPQGKSEDVKPGSLKPPQKKPQNAAPINTDDFFNEFLNNPNKKDPFAGL